MSHHGFAGSCNQLCFSISSLLGYRGPGSDATGRISGSMCSSSALRALGLRVHQDLSVCSLWCCSMRLAGSLALPLEPPPCAGANTCPGLTSIPIRGGFELCPSILQFFFVPQDTTSCRKRGALIVPLGTTLAYTHDGPLTSHTWNLRPSCSFIGTGSSPLCFSLCPLADTRWGFLLGSMGIHSKSRGEHTCKSAKCLPIRVQHTCFLDCRIAAKKHPVSKSTSSILIHGDGTVPSVVLGDSRVTEESILQ